VGKVIERHGLSQRHACRLVGLDRSTLRYQRKRPDDAALRQRLRDLAAERRRFGYRRLGWMLAREGHAMNHKKLYRLYREEQLMVRRRRGRKRALGTRAPMTLPGAINQRWSLDFVAARLIDGRWFRVLTVVDQFTRERVLLLADSSLNGHKVALALSQVIAERGAPTSITVDNGTEFASKAMDAWAYQYGVQLNFIRPGRPVENCYIESFNGRLRDECLNVEVFFALIDVRDKLERWRRDYNQVRPHSALRDSAPAVFAAQWTETAALGPEAVSVRRESPRRVIHWRYSLESVECKKRRPDRP
jgi:putative transposase